MGARRHARHRRRARGPALAASYANARGQSLTVFTLEHKKHTGDAQERRDSQLVALADAAVVVWEEGSGVWEMLGRVRAKGIPLVVLGGPVRPKTPAVDAVEPSRRGLPD